MPSRAVVGKFSHPFYKYLTTNAPNPNNVTRITLNYEKFLVDAEGKVLRRCSTKSKALRRSCSLSFWP